MLPPHRYDAATVTQTKEMDEPDAYARSTALDAPVVFLHTAAQASREEPVVHARTAARVDHSVIIHTATPEEPDVYARSAVSDAPVCYYTLQHKRPEKSRSRTHTLQLEWIRV